jgi:hypothetical protein
MFRFLTPRPSDRANPLQSQKAAAAWFRRLPATDRIGRSVEVIRALDELARANTSANAAGVAAIAYLDMELGPDRRHLIAQYVDRVDANPAIAERAWKAAYDIIQAFIAAYRKLLGDASAPAAESRLRREIGPIIGRLIHCFNSDAKIRALKTEHWIPQKWAEVHRVYRQAVELGIDRAPPPEGGSGNAASRRTIEQEYIAVLLTHLVNVGTLAPSQIQWVLAQVQAWCRGLRLEPTPTDAYTFFVDLDGRRGLVRRGKDKPGPAARHLDTMPMTAKIEKALAALRHGGEGDGDRTTTVHRQRITALEKLRAMIGPDTAPAVSREPRTAVSFEADLRAGLARICEELAAADRGRHAAGASARLDGPIPGTQPAGATEARNTRAPKGAGDRLNAPIWRVRNRSHSGFGITSVGGGSRLLALGTLVAVRPREGGDWSLGVVRRVVRATPDTVDMGLSVIAQHFSALALYAKRQAREEMGFVVDGIDVSTLGARFDGLYLSPRSRPSKSPASNSIVIPASEYAEGRSIVAIAAQVVYTIVLRELIERHGDWCWAAIEIVDRQKRT